MNERLAGLNLWSAFRCTPLRRMGCNRDIPEHRLAPEAVEGNLREEERDMHPCYESTVQANTKEMPKKGRQGERA